MIGQSILQYQILEKLGEGGMGVVDKAQDTKVNRFVALKFLPSHLSASREEKERFVQEEKVASAINHPNICLMSVKTGCISQLTNFTNATTNLDYPSWSYDGKEIYFSLTQRVGDIFVLERN